jgi:septation ring formation regulator EzrA
LPERNFPGVVVQGDTLHALQKQVAQMGQLLSAMDLDELAAEIEYLNEQLSNALTHFERVCADRGIALPY